MASAQPALPRLGFTQSQTTCALGNAVQQLAMVLVPEHHDFLIRMKKKLLVIESSWNDKLGKSEIVKKKSAEDLSLISSNRNRTQFFSWDLGIDLSMQEGIGR